MPSKVRARVRRARWGEGHTAHDTKQAVKQNTSVIDSGWCVGGMDTGQWGHIRSHLPVCATDWCCVPNRFRMSFDLHIAGRQNPRPLGWGDLAPHPTPVLSAIKSPSRTHREHNKSSFSLFLTHNLSFVVCFNDFYKN